MFSSEEYEIPFLCNYDDINENTFEVVSEKEEYEYFSEEEKT